MTFSSVLATSSNNNNEESESNSDQSNNDDNGDATSSEENQQQQQESTIDEESSEDGNNNNGDQSPVESQNITTDSSQEIPLQNNNQILPNTLTGNLGIQERSPDNVILVPEDGAIESLPPNGVNVVKYTKEIGQNCYDRVDNDNDGKIDYENDEDCHPPQNGCIGTTFYACHEICDDGIDNDGDGFTDMQDLGPDAPKDNNGGRMCMSIESFSVASGCFGLGPSLRVFDCVEICNDLVDNDENGITDGNPCSRDPLNPSGYVIKSTPPPNLNLGG